MDIKREYAIGDDAWIFVGNHQGELSKGKVVHAFDLLDWPGTKYVIEVPTHIDPLLEVRDWMSMSDTPAGPIGMWRMLQR